MTLLTIVMVEVVLFSDPRRQHTGLQYTSLQYTGLQYTDLQYTGLQYTDLKYTCLQYPDLLYTGLRYTGLQYIGPNVKEMLLTATDLRHVTCAT